MRTNGRTDTSTTNGAIKRMNHSHGVHEGMRTPKWISRITIRSGAFAFIAEPERNRTRWVCGSRMNHLRMGHSWSNIALMGLSNRSFVQRMITGGIGSFCNLRIMVRYAGSCGCWAMVVGLKPLCLGIMSWKNSCSRYRVLKQPLKNSHALMRTRLNMLRIPRATPPNSAIRSRRSN